MPEIFTSIGDTFDPVASKDQDSYIYLETTPGGSLGRGIHLNSINIGKFTRELGTTVFERAQSSFDSAMVIGKTSSKASGSGTVSPTDLLYILNSLVAKVTPTVPTNNGKYILDLRGATGGTFTLTFNAVATTALTVSTLTAKIIGDALVALSTLGRGCCEVIQEDTGVYAINLLGQYAVLGTLTATLGSVTGGAGGSFLASPNATGLGIYRWTFPLTGSPIIQTYNVFQGLPDSPEKATSAAYAFFASLGITVTDKEVSMTTSMEARTIQTRQSIVLSDFTDISLVLAHTQYWNFYSGKTRIGEFGPAMLCNAFAATAELNDYQMGLKTVGCNQPSFKGHMKQKPKTSFSLTLMENEEGLELVDAIQEGTQLYFVMEYLGPEIVGGYPYRILFCFPYLSEQISSTEMDGAQAIQLSGRMAQQGTVLPTIIIDTNISSL